MKKHEGLSLMVLNALHGSKKNRTIKGMKKHEGLSLMILNSFMVQKRTIKGMKKHEGLSLMTLNALHGSKIQDH